MRLKRGSRTGDFSWLVVAIAAHVAFVGGARAVTPAELVTPDLEAQPVSVAGLHEGVLSFFDDQRQLRREPVEAFVRLEMRRSEAMPAPPVGGEPGQLQAVVETVDGQRIIGQWQPRDDGAVAIDIYPPMSLDNVRSISFAGLTVGAAEGGAIDVVTFGNGDRMEGFVVALMRDGVSLQPQGQAGAVMVPWPQVRAVQLANPPAAPPPTAGEHLLRLRDGTRLLVSQVTISAGELHYGQMRGFGPADSLGIKTRSIVPLPLVAGLDFLGSGWQVLDLADQPMTLREGGTVFGAPTPPRWEGSPAVLRAHGPATVAFTLPAGATRVAATVELDLDGVPTHLREWADLTITFGGSKDVVRLTAANPSVTLNAPVNGDELLLVIDAGVNGPILDRVRVRDAVVLVRRSVTAPPSVE